MLVFSIRPRYVARILDGSKRWEFRTRRPSMGRGETFAIYETAPTSRIVAYAKTGEILDASPAEVWKRTKADGGVTLVEFTAYFEGRSRAVAIEISEVEKLAEPIPLPAGMRAPQSWSRLRDETT